VCPFPLLLLRAFLIRRGDYACSNRKNYRAGWLEKMVMDAIVNTFQPPTWESFVEDGGPPRS
jgi:hypothetical protein